MEIELVYLPEKKERKIDLPSGSRAERILEKLDLLSESYLLSRDGRIIISDEELRAGDRITLIRVASGG
jgi:sulfur carrier protein ThiS